MENITQPEEKKLLQVEVSADLFRSLRIEAIKRDSSLRAITNEALTDWLERESADSHPSGEQQKPNTPNESL